MTNHASHHVFAHSPTDAMHTASSHSLVHQAPLSPFSAPLHQEGVEGGKILMFGLVPLPAAALFMHKHGMPHGTFHAISACGPSSRPSRGIDPSEPSPLPICRQSAGSLLSFNLKRLVGAAAPVPCGPSYLALFLPLFLTSYFLTPAPRPYGKTLRLNWRSKGSLLPALGSPLSVLGRRRPGPSRLAPPRPATRSIGIKPRYMLGAVHCLQ